MARFQTVALCGFAVLASLFGAPATFALTVNATQSAHFRFDLTSVNPGSVEVDGLFYECNDTCIGEATTSPPDTPNILAMGASFQIDFGTVWGGNDLGVRFVVNDFPFNISNMTALLRSSPGNGAYSTLGVSNIDYLFATIMFYDDSFGIDRLNLFGDGFPLVSGYSCDPGPECSPPPAVPLPAALPLILSAIGSLGFVGWRRKRKASATA